jgi:hypothetical protein
LIGLIILTTCLTLIIAKNKIYNNFHNQKINYMQEILDEKARIEAQERKMRAIHQRTKERPIYERYEAVRLTGIYGTIFTFLVSFGTGIAFFYYLFLPSMYWQIAVGLAVGVGLFVEVMRTFIFDAFWRVWFEEKRVSVPLRIIGFWALVFLAISFTTSMYGAKWSYEDFDRGAQQEKASHKLDLASLRKKYDDRIAAETRAYQSDATLSTNQKRVDAEKKALADFKASITWQGAINISDPQVAGNISAFNNRITALEAENIRYAKSRQAQYENTLKRIEAERDGTITTETKDHELAYGQARAKTEFNTWVWVVIAIIVEFFALAFAWLPYWYYYYCAKVMDLLNPLAQGLESQYAKAYKTLGQYLQYHLLGSGQDFPNTYQVLNQEKGQDLKQDLPKKAPGFEVGKSKMPETLEEALLKGIKDTRVLTSQYNVNPAMIAQAKEKLGIKKSIPATPKITTDLTLFGDLRKGGGV